MKIIGYAQKKRTPEQQTALAVRVLDQLHAPDVLQKLQDVLGERANRVGPVDMSRNVLTSYVNRYTTYRTPPLVGDLSEELADLMGDYSSVVTVARYEALGGRPMPSVLVVAAAAAYRYRLGAGYAGLHVGYSKRTGRLVYTVASPDDLRLEYASDDPNEPTVIRWQMLRKVKGEVQAVWDTYDLTDPDSPSYRVLDQHGKDLTSEAHETTYEGDGYVWRDDDGTPFHPVVISGHPNDRWRASPLVEATLSVAARWTAWGSGLDTSSHPQRNVRGMSLARVDTTDVQQGIAVGAEDVAQWTDDNPDRPGDHWQDAPAFDPLTTGQAIRLYESSALSMLGIPISLENTGGDPTDIERQAMAEEIASTYAECRRADGEVIARSAMLANRLPDIEGESFAESGYSALYREEIPTPTPEPPPDV